MGKPKHLRPRQAKRRSLLRLGLTGAACALAVALSTGVQAARQITSFPAVENFDTDAWTQDLIKQTQGALWEWDQAGGWSGGAAKFFPPTIQEGYSGLGSFLLDSMGSSVTKLNLRFLAYHGRTLASLGPNNSKLVIFNPQSGTRPMILKNNRCYPDGPCRGWENEEYFGYYGACMSTECAVHDGWPTPGSGFQYGNPARPDNYSEEWVSIELEANAENDTIKMFIYTRDGRISGLQAQCPDAAGRCPAFNGNYFERIDGVPGYWGNTGDGWPRVYDEHTYIKIDELVIHGNLGENEQIGPPEGFLTDAPPAAPSNLRVGQ